MGMDRGVLLPLATATQANIYEGKIARCSPAKELPPPPLRFRMNKPLADSRLGVHFNSEGEGGAVVHRVIHGSVAWGAGLRVGDVVFSAGDVTQQHPVVDGYNAARILRNIAGSCVVCVHRRKATAHDRAAHLIHAIVRGYYTRCCLRTARTAAITIQSAWRKMDAELCLWGSVLAAQHIQLAFRHHLDGRLSARSLSPSTPIRSPPRLIPDEID